MFEAGLIHIGISGWHYRHWEGPYYPGGLETGDYLGHYSRDFETVEINSTFYGLPEENTLVSWRETVPHDFRFSVKANRYITHMKKLTDPQEPLEKFFQRVRCLKEKLGPVLFQLPPNWRANVSRLTEFVKMLPKGGQYAFEFREASWFNADVYAALRAHNMAFCIYNLAGRTSPKEVTADLIYMRFHGAGEAYQGKYSSSQLEGWAKDISAWVSRDKQVYCYFNNDPHADAVQNALELKRILGVR